MNLYQSAFQTIFNDVRRMEDGLITSVLQDPIDAKLIGSAHRMRWIRMWLESISDWTVKNPIAEKAPDSFLPELNREILSHMFPEAGAALDKMDEENANNPSDEIGG